MTDRDKAVEFYGQTLGLERNPLASDEWPELGADNVGFVLSTPEQKGGGEFKPEVSIALRVPDVAASMERLRRPGRGGPSRTSRTIRASVTWRSSATLTATP